MSVNSGLRAWAVVLLVFAVPSFAAAQEAAPAKAAPPPPPVREGTAELSFVGTTGNSDTESFGLAGEMIVRPTNWVVRNKAGYVRNSANGNVSAESFAYLFRGDRVLSPRLSAFGQYDYLHDRFAGVEHRNAITGGLAYAVLSLERHRVVVDGGFGYLNEQRTVGENVSSGTYGSGAMYKWTISATALFTDELRYTGTFAESADWRIAQSAALTARLTGLLALKVSNSIRYAHLPPTGFKTTDTVTGIALVAKF